MNNTDEQLSIERSSSSASTLILTPPSVGNKRKDKQHELQRAKCLKSNMAIIVSICIHLYFNLCAFYHLNFLNNCVMSLHIYCCIYSEFILNEIS